MRCSADVTISIPARERRRKERLSGELEKIRRFAKASNVSVTVRPDIYQIACERKLPTSILRRQIRRRRRRRDQAILKRIIRLWKRLVPQIPAILLFQPRLEIDRLELQHPLRL